LPRDRCLSGSGGRLVEGPAIGRTLLSSMHRHRMLRTAAAGDRVMKSHEAIPSLAMLRAFEVYGRLGGVRKTALHMNIDHAVVSRHLRSLEDFVGTALIARHDVDRCLTEDGLYYHGRVSEALREIASATTVLKRRHDQRLLVWCAPGFAFHWLTRRLPDFQKSYPSIDLELRPSDGGPDFSTNQADLDIRYVRGPELPESTTLKTMEIARPSVFPVASPDYLRGIAPIGKAEDLLSARLLHEDSIEEWQMWLEAQGVAARGELPGPRLWQAHLALDAARDGQGIALANQLLSADDLASGRLVKVEASEASFRAVPLGTYMMFGRPDRWRSIPMVRFRQWLTSTIPADV
jgi:LysR family glycine cleavage system transcriptional activator